MPRRLTGDIVITASSALERRSSSSSQSLWMHTNQHSQIYAQPIIRTTDTLSLSLSLPHPLSLPPLSLFPPLSLTLSLWLCPSLPPSLSLAVRMARTALRFVSSALPSVGTEEQEGCWRTLRCPFGADKCSAFQEDPWCLLVLCFMANVTTCQWCYESQT